MKVLLKIPMSTYSGYGNDGIGLAQAFIRRGDDVYISPTHFDFPIPENLLLHVNKELKAPFDLFINHVDPMALDAKEEITRHSGVSMGWTMWEYDNLLNMGKAPLKTIKKRLKHFDLIAGYSDLDAASFQPYYKGPIIVQQGGFEPGNWPEIERDWSSREFYFFSIGVLSERKDPFRTIDAFKLARERDPEFWRWARLSLKTTAPGLHHKIEDLFRDNDPETGEEFTSLRVFYDIWPVEVVKAFYAQQHVLISSSRGEGKNMPALEFMSTGGTVIATNWAGHTQWLNPAYSYPLDYTLAPVGITKIDRNTQNARASVEHLAELMLHCFHNRAEVRDKGRLAAQVIPASHSWDSVVERLLLKIKDNVPEKGEKLWALSRMTG